MQAGWAADIVIGRAALRAAALEYPNNNIELKDVTRVIDRHEGAPKPKPPSNPNLQRWDIYLIKGKRPDWKGSVQAGDEQSAAEAAVSEGKVRAVDRMRIRVVPTSR